MAEHFRVTNRNCCFQRFSLLLIVITMVLSVGLSAAAVEGAAIPKSGIWLQSVLPTPVYNCADIPALYYTTDPAGPNLRLDDKGHLRALEFIALVGSKFELQGMQKFGGCKIYTVTTSEYPVNKRLYIDSRFVRVCSASTPQRSRILPQKEDILKDLGSLVGMPYRWGGNYSPGIRQMLEFYPVKGAAAEKYLQEHYAAWILRGVDCSGMLYEATGGSIPRNTSELVEFGSAVSIAGQTAAEIAAKLRPLDLIVWSGHIVVVYTNNRVIESRPRYPDGHEGGVRIEPLLPRLEEIMRTRKPVDAYNGGTAADKQFVIRRFSR